LSSDEKTEQRGPWKIFSEEKVYDNDWITLTHREVETPSGTPGIYGTVHFKNIAVGIVPVDEHLHTWLVKQYRFPLEEETWEIPEGGSPVGESVDATAYRELEEETGMRAEKMTLFLEMDLSNSVTDERACVFLATGISEGSRDLDDTEDIEAVRMPVKEALQLLDQGKIRDSLSVAALLKLQLAYPELCK
jgi:8-oxo-dGTP pyrophosphatase MutT (NUDIX family)